MYIKQTANTLRTFGECFLNTYEIGCETPRNSPRPPRNWLRNTPSIPHVHHEIGCEHSVRRRGRFIVPVSWHYQLHIFALPNTHFPSPLRMCLRIRGRDKSAPTAANGLPITWRTLCKTPTYTPWKIHKHLRKTHKTFCKHSTLTYEIGCEHSVRRRGRFIVPVS